MLEIKEKTPASAVKGRKSDARRRGLMKNSANMFTPILPDPTREDFL